MTEEQAKQLQDNVLGKNKTKTSVWNEDVQKQQAILDGANDGTPFPFPTENSMILIPVNVDSFKLQLFQGAYPNTSVLQQALGFTRLDIPPMGAVRTTKASMSFNKAYKRYCEWKDKVRSALGMQDDVWGIDIVAFLEVPKSRTINGKSKVYAKQERCDMVGNLAKVKPDWDNIAKGVQDACMTEDSAVSVGFCSKWYCRDGEERMYVRFRKNN